MLQLLKQDVINFTSSFQYQYEENPVHLMLLLLSVVVITFGAWYLVYCSVKYVPDSDEGIQSISMKMNYVYEGVSYSSVFINERNDGKIDIVNSNGEKMFEGVEDAMMMCDTLSKLKK